MLNDLSTYARLTLLFQVAPLGMLIGLAIGQAAVGADGMRGPLIIFVLAMTTIVVWCVLTVTWMRRMSRRMHRDIAWGSEEIVSGQVDASLVPARVLRVRRWKRNRPWGMGREVDPTTPAGSVAFTVLPPDGPPRRVGALVPLDLPVKSSALLALHPTLAEVGVLDLGATNDQLAGAAQDPRWSSERMPTDRTVVGGYLPLLAAVIAGVVGGGALAVLVLLVVG